MTVRTSTNAQTEDTTQPDRAAQARMIPAGSAVMSVVVRVAGIVPARLDLTHVGTPEQQLGLSVGTVLVYLRSALTARAVAQGWGNAVVQARSLSPAIAGRRPLVVGPSTVGVIAQLAGGMPQIVSSLLPAHRGPDAVQVLRILVGPVVWEVCDTNAYTSLLRAWRQAGGVALQQLREFDDDEEFMTP
jgi:hypothetical protein